MKTSLERIATLVLGVLVACAPSAISQVQPSSSSSSDSSAQAGGPQGDLGPIAVPKKREEAPKKDDVPARPQKVEGLGNVSLKVASQLVTLDVGVLSRDGVFIPGLKKEHFRVYEDGVPQAVTSFGQIEAPITAAMLVEFSNNQYFYSFQVDSIKNAYIFSQTLKKDDWVAMISYDLKPHILEDFTQDKQAILGAISSLRPGMAMSSETNLFDALIDTLDRLDGVEGRKYIILITSGRDSFSKHTLDQALKRVQGSKDTAIYVVATGKALVNYAQTHGFMRLLCPMTEFNCEMTFAQADNQLKAFAKMTGGRFYEPMFDGQLREIYADISQTIRNQYSLAYRPTNSAQDGTYRKIKVELVDEVGQPLKMRDQKGKEVTYQVISREGYKAKPQVE
jgi:VWFA-related protein